MSCLICLSLTYSQCLLTLYGDLTYLLWVYIFHNCICPNLHQICYNPVAIKARFCMFLVCKLVTLLQILKYAFKTFTFCIVAFGYSIVICGKWFLRFFACFHIHAGLASWFYGCKC